ncbi:MAG: KpsF/GutQ family sugar-phosphate isomerase [Opitutae bacterium]
MDNLPQEAQEAKEVLAKEALAIQEVANRLIPQEFSNAIDILFKKEGKIIVTGIGKSGHVGKKMAAMLCSTGSPTTFLHPSEAVHGDLGIHQEGDPVIFLSNSGSTPELLYLEPVFRARGAKIVGILGKQKSPLAKKVDVVLDASVNEEADPLGIVPTSSFAAAAALGDAIGSALMKRRNFDSTEYAKTHPAGQLGRNLLLKVKDVFHPVEKVSCLTRENSIKDAVIGMSKYPLGAACILDKKQLIGIITDGDLRRALLEKDNINTATALEIMSHHPQTIGPEESLGFALELMEKRKPSPVSLLPVVCPKTETFLGLIRLHDVLSG